AEQHRERLRIPQGAQEVEGMERSLAQVALVVREGVLHERDQRWEDGRARRDQGPAHGLRELALIAAEMLDKVLRRGRHYGRGVSRMVAMVHHVLLSRVRRAYPGTVVGPCPGRHRDVAGFSWNGPCTHHTTRGGSSPGAREALCHPRSPERAQTPVNRRGRQRRGGQTSGESPRASWSWLGP